MRLRFILFWFYIAKRTCIEVLQSESVKPLPQFPLRLIANVQVTSHLILPDEGIEDSYPPRTRDMTIYYDYINKRARIDIESGYEAAKVYIRRYDLEKEYMIRLPPINDCKRSFLGETMHFPEIENTSYIGTEEINGITYNYFLHEDYETRIHLYFNEETGGPFRLIHEEFIDGVSTPLLTYQYSDVIITDEIPEVTFDVEKIILDTIGTSLNASQCIRHIGGFPYIHIFHAFLRI